MVGAEDFIDADPFDPATYQLVEEAEARGAQTTSAAVRAYLERRKNSYTAVFAGNASAEDVKFVMYDLARFCRAYELTFDPTNPKRQDLLEGRREVFLRIMQFTRLSHDELYYKYVTDAQRGK